MKRTIKFLMPVLGLFAMTIPTLVNAKSANAEITPSNVEMVKAPDIPELNNLKAHSLVTPTDNYYNTQKNYSMRNLGDIEGVWDHYQGTDRYIAVIDNGFNPYDNEYFVGNDFSTCRISEYSASFVYNSTTNYVTITKGTDSGHTRTSKDDDAWDFLLPEHETDGSFTSNRKHGTHVASTVGAGMNNSGVVGVAPKAKLILLKVANYQFWECGYAMKYLYELASESGVTIDAVNMSFGSNDSTWNNSSSSYIFQYYLAKLHSLGTVMIAAAGNDNTSTNSYPACNNYVIGIGALDKNSNTEKASFSNFNSATASQSGNHNVDLAAPGYVYVSSMTGTYTSVSQTYTSTQGTSFAAPIVAAAVGLYKQYNPTATVTEAENALYDACVDIGDSGWDATFGYGRLDVSRLVPTSGYVSGVELDQTSYTGYHNTDSNTVQLTATVLPLSATNKNVTWASSDTGVATVSSTGLVTLKSAGSATITVTTSEGGFTATCLITSKTYIPVTSVALLDTSNNASGTLTVGQHMQLHISVTPSNATNKDVDYDTDDSSIATVTSSGYVTAVGPGTTSIFCYVGNELVEGVYQITVNAVQRTLQSIAIATAPTKTTYNVGETFSLSGAVVNATFSTAPTTENVTSSCTFTPSGALKETDKSVTISYTYGGVTKSVTQAITVVGSTSPEEYTLLENAALLHVGDSVIFVGKNGTNTYAMSKTQNTNNRGQVSITISNNVISTVPSDVCEFQVGTSNDHYTFYDPNYPGYIGAASSNSNQLKTTSEAGSNQEWTISVSNGNAEVVAQGNYTRKNLRYNTSGIFACYSSGQQPVQIYYKQASAKVNVTGVTLNKDALSIDVGENSILTATVAPSDATNKKVTWSSDDETIATVSNGVVHGVSAGSATITVTTDDGGFTATSNVTVNAVAPVTLESISITTNPTKLTYTEGETFSPSGAIVTAYMSNGTNKTVTATWTPSGALKTTDTIATASYTEGGITKTATVAITVNEAQHSDEVEIDFKQINGFSSWTNSYGEHTVQYDDVTVHFAGASRQSGTITNMPVVKNAAVTITAKNSNIISTVNFVFKQWTTKTQTATLNYSTDGSNFTSTGVTSTSDFKLVCNSLPTGTKAIRLTFASANQMGIEGVTIGFASSANEPLTAAVAWAKSFNEALTCDASGNTAPNATTWNTLKTEYLALDASVKAYFESAAYSLSGNGLVVTAENGTDEDIAKAVAKYDYICGKYSSSTYANFMNRTPASLSNLNTFVQTETTVLAVATLFLVALSFTTLFIFRRKKESE